jgi:hypothetical protein
MISRKPQEGAIGGKAEDGALTKWIRQENEILTISYFLDKS